MNKKDSIVKGLLIVGVTAVTAKAIQVIKKNKDLTKEVSNEQ